MSDTARYLLSVFYKTNAITTEKITFIFISAIFRQLHVLPAAEKSTGRNIQLIVLVIYTFQYLIIYLSILYVV